MYLYTFQKGRPIQLDGLTLSNCTSEIYFQETSVWGNQQLLTFYFKGNKEGIFVQFLFNLL